MITEGELEKVLGRMVRRVCPAWLSEQREDLVQNACLRIVRKWRDAEESQPLQASYLWKVAHSVVMDEIRHNRRRPEVTLENPGIVEPVSQAASPERRRAAGELGEAISEGVKRLSEARRWALLLYLYGFSLQDSAKMLGWNSKRVDNQRYQGLAELRAYLKERGFQP
jgi:RNA polymerase sigma factor (sigma-70 family)